jgi:putative endonuclease
VRTPYGEIDLVTRQKEVTVFVEVKTRTNRVYGHPEDAITSQKKDHLIASAQDFLLKHPEISGEYRIDVIAILRLSRQVPQIEYFENAIF